MGVEGDESFCYGGLERPSEEAVLEQRHEWSDEWNYSLLLLMAI